MTSGASIADREPSDRDLVAPIARSILERAGVGLGSVAVIVGAPGSGRSTRARALADAVAAGGARRCASGDDIVAVCSGGETVVAVVDVSARDEATTRSRTLSSARVTLAYPLILIVVLRTGDPFARELDVAHVVRIETAPWPTSALARLIARRSPHAEPRAAALAERACGNPRHALESTHADPPASLARALAYLRATYEPPTLRALGVLAATALGDAVARPALLEKRDLPQATAALDAAYAAELLGDGHFYDERARLAAESLLGTPAAVRRCHAALAARLIGMQRSQTAITGYRAIAAHLAASDDPHAAAEYYVAYANACLLEKRHGEAVRHYEHALACGLGSPHAEAKASVDLATAMLASGDYAGARAAASRGARRFEALGARRECAAAEILCSRIAYLDVRRTDDALASEPIRRRAVRADDVEARVEGLVAVAGWRLGHHDLDGVRAIMSDLATVASESLSPALVVRWSSIRTIANVVGARAPVDMAASRRDLERAVATGMREEATYVASCAARNLAILQTIGGDLEGAKRSLAIALEGALAAHRLDATQGVYADIARLALLEGDLARATSVLALSDDAVTDAVAIARLWPRALVDARTERRAIVCREARRLFDLATTSGDPDDRLLTGAALVHLLPDAESDERGRVARAALAPVRWASATYLAVSLTAPHGGPETTAHGRELIARLAHTHDPRLVAACAALLEATALERGSPAASRASLTAERAFTDLGWSLPAAVARSLRPAIAARALSDRERDVARYAAIGVRNRDIARRLDVTTSTVEKHVSAVLSKLGIESRREIGDAIRDPEPVN